MALFRIGRQTVFFAHVPRCAGSSVEDVIAQRFGKPGFLDHRYRKRKEPWTRTSPQHVTVDALHALVPPGLIDHCFAVVRHPVDRVQSAFLFQRDREKNFPADMSFSDALDLLADPAFRHDDRFDNHFRLQIALVPKEAVVFRLEDGLDRVIQHIDGLADTAENLDGFAPHLNASKASKVDLTAEEHAKLEAIYKPDYERFGYDLYRAPLSMADAMPVPAEAARPPKPRRIAIKADVPNLANRNVSGDWHFGSSLATALERIGHEVRVDCVPEWYLGDRPPVDINIVLRGHTHFDRQADNTPTLYWILYPGRKPKDFGKLLDELQGADHVALSSLKQMSQVAEALGGGGTQVSALMQCFDASRMYIDPQAKRAGHVFVGNNLFGGGLRPILRLALEAEYAPRIFGGYFDGSPARDLVEAPSIANEDLGDLYRSAQFVLCDHMPGMRAHGYISNRIFDALACGAPVLCDYCPGMPVEFEPHVLMCQTADDFAAATEIVQKESAEDRAERYAFGQDLAVQHSFDARARQIGDLIDRIHTP